ncbi:MAG: fibronectin type III domain-containing protein [Candidatus Methylacidiphilales bacterium]|nr:fibronectin type III domain-containing protein [Candidatus Methylacidiphilales bacterium]
MARFISAGGGTLLAGLFAIALTPLQATDLDTIGVTALRAYDSTLTGNGVAVAMVEATETNGGWQPNPNVSGLNTSLFSFFSASTPYPTGSSYNATLESGHATSVGYQFYSTQFGVSTGVAAVRSFEANYFIGGGGIIQAQTNISTPIVNQSFVFNSTSNSTFEQLYDHYADRYSTLFVNGVNDTSNTFSPPSTMFNCISVGLTETYGSITNNSSVGPTPDGRSKPDLAAPSFATSYAAPYVSGSAAILRQAALRNDGGNSTASAASDPRTIKALLLNGAVKPSNWTRTGSEPLDRRFGAGVLNVYNSYFTLNGGRQTPQSSGNQTSPGSSHLPVNNTNNSTTLNGWNQQTLTTITTAGGKDVTDHYFFNLPSASSNTFNATATLVWHRQNGQTTINNLDLFLYNTVNNTLVATSNSTVNNVEHLYLPSLPAGRYCLQVYKPFTGRTSNAETYALAFNFAANPKPNAPTNASAIPLSSSSLRLQWTDASSDETGFRIENSSSANGTYSVLTTLSANSTSYDHTGLAAGTTYYYRIYATKAAGDSPSASTSNTTFTLLENWRLVNFGNSSNSGNGSDSSDPDGDGLDNLVEYATGSSPLDPATASPLALVSDPSRLKVSFPRIADADLVYAIWASPDLANWGTTPIWTSTGVENTAGPVTVTDIQDITAALRRFLQLRITRASAP